MEHQKQNKPTVADDPKARELLRQAFEKTARWQKDFTGIHGRPDRECEREGNQRTRHGQKSS